VRSTGLAAALALALVLAAPAAAHVIASPTFLPAGETQTLELSVPNERDAPMTSFVLTAPAELEVVGAEDTEGWDAAVVGQTATWSGGTLPSKLSETFGLRVQATGEPGAVELEAEQRYADGEVRWPVALTIVPGTADSSSGGGGGLVIALVAVGVVVTLAVGLVAVLARRRRAGPLQER
jgi:hypothetical protein